VNANYKAANYKASNNRLHQLFGLPKIFGSVINIPNYPRH